MTTLDKPLTQSAAMKAARDIQLSNYRAATLATENMMLRASVTALLDAIDVLGVAEYMEDGVVQQALTALEWAPASAQEGAGDAT